MIWDHALSQIVEFREILSMRRRKLPRIPHIIECQLVRRAGPHFLLALHFRIKGFGAKRPLDANAIFNGVSAILVQHSAMPFPASNLCFEPSKLALPHRIKIDRNDRCIMREVLKHFAVPGEMASKHRFAIVLIAAPQDVVMRATDHLDRIKLYKAEGLDQGIKVGLSCGCLRKPLPSEPKSPGITIGNAKGRAIRHAYSIAGQPPPASSVFFKTQSKALPRISR